MHFKCANNLCVLTTYVCDGIQDCEDNSDELNCHDTPKTVLEGTMTSSNGTGDLQYDNCTELHLYCGSGECIPRDQQCDGQGQCADVSDEMNCPTVWRVDAIVLDHANRMAYISNVSHYKMLILGYLY